MQGTGTLPPAGADFLAADSLLTSPAVSSWFFGNGAKWLNQDLAGNTQLIAASNLKIASVDSFLTANAASRARGRVFGGRVARALTNHLDVEVAVDASSGSYGLMPATLTGLQSAASSFTSVWNTILTQNLPSATAVGVLGGTVDPGDQVFTTGALSLSWRHGRISPYLTAGAGIVVNHGSVVADLDGNLKYAVGSVSKSEDDVVTIAFTQVRTEPVLLLGVGFTVDVTPRTGIRFDLRSYISANPDRTSVSAAPATTGTATVEDFLSAGTLNTIVFQFSGVPGIPSTLSVPVSNFQSYTGAGMRSQATLTVGAFFRF